MRRVALAIRVRPERDEDVSVLAPRLPGRGARSFRRAADLRLRGVGRLRQRARRARELARALPRRVRPPARPRRARRESRQLLVAARARRLRRPHAAPPGESRPAGRDDRGVLELPPDRGRPRRPLRARRRPARRARPRHAPHVANDRAARDPGVGARPCPRVPPQRAAAAVVRGGARYRVPAAVGPPAARAVRYAPRRARACAAPCSARPPGVLRLLGVRPRRLRRSQRRRDPPRPDVRAAHRQPRDREVPHPGYSERDPSRLGPGRREWRARRSS